MAKWSDFETHPVGTGTRIEKLEAKLAKAVEDLELALDLADNGLVDFDKYCLSCDADINERYRATLAELRGQNDEPF